LVAAAEAETEVGAGAAMGQNTLQTTFKP